MFKPTIETKKKFISWFIKSYQLKRREELWILNYLLNHELLLKHIHFVENAEHAPKGIQFVSVACPEKQFAYFKKGLKIENPEQAFHDLRLSWKEPCYISLCFPSAYKTLVSFGVLEHNPYETLQDEQTEVDLSYLEQDTLKEQLLRAIDEALKTGDKERFFMYTQQLNELEKKEN